MVLMVSYQTGSIPMQAVKHVCKNNPYSVINCNVKPLFNTHPPSGKGQVVNALYIEVLFTVNLITDNFVCRDSVTGQLNGGWLFNT